MQRYGSLLGLSLLLAGVPVIAVSHAPNDNLEHNRQLLEKWRKDPEHYQRLRENLDTFWALPIAEQQQMRQLDHDLHAVSPDRQKKLMRVLVRYQNWMGRLRQRDPETYARIQAAPRAARVALLRATRKKQWIESLPDQLRERLLKLPPDQQAKEIVRLRKEEREHRREWTRPDWFHMRRPPRRFSEFPPKAQAEVKQFVSELLKPHLAQRERELLNKAKGSYTLNVLSLAHNHPEILPPLPGEKPVTRFDQLPPHVRKLLPERPKGKGKGKPRLRRPGEWRDSLGKWPDFALNVVRAIEYHHKDVSVPALGASRPHEFPPLARDFIEHHLVRVLTAREIQELREAEGKWPHYPHLVRDLAQKHRLLMPPLALPGPSELWQPSGPGDRGKERPGGRGPGKRPRPPKEITLLH
jgi:hypothetical protein